MSYHYVQVLRSVNPAVSYSSSTKGYLVRGVAISLNLFLKQLDVLGVEHESAAVIRRDLRTRDDAMVGRYKQYFLRGRSTQTKISRSGPDARHQIKCRTSVAIPRAWLSNSVMNYLTGRFMYMYNVKPLYCVFGIVVCH